MHLNALRARARRRGAPKGDGERSQIAANILDRDFRAAQPYRKWLAGFTYIWTAEGWLYVAGMLGLFSRRIVGWSMKAERNASLIMDALMMAVWRGGKADSVLHHSDQGSQYTSERFQRLLADNGITCSMTRAENVRDNSAVDSFFSSLKIERTARKVYRTHNDCQGRCVRRYGALLQSAASPFKTGISQPNGVRSKGCSCPWSSTIRTARARTSGENLFVVLLKMAHRSQKLSPPANPGSSKSVADLASRTSVQDLALLVMRCR